MIVLVCGGRDYTNVKAIRDSLDMVDVTSIIAGGASGADAIGREEAIRRKLDFKMFPADWSAHGRAAGPIRNKQMLDEGKPDLVMAFPGGRGTADMVRRAKAAGVPVMEIQDDEVTGAAI